MRNKRLGNWLHYIGLIMTLCLISSFKTDTKKKNNNDTNLVTSSVWYLAGPTIENQEVLNNIRKKDTIIRVTATNSPVGEIELNVLITPSQSNDGSPTNLPEDSNFVSITYKSSHPIKLQAREGNEDGTGCVHGGSHPRVDLPISPDKFTTIKIPWSDFKQDGLPNGKRLNIHNLCKFNFVNYKPVAGATLEITAVLIQNLKQSKN